MNNLESLKQELLLQKSVIESMGGVVNVANRNPSPSEITRGISSISVPDFSGADATEQDVLLGKKFYAGSNELKTGKFSLDELNLAKRHIFEYQEDVIYSERRFAYDIPTDIPVLRYGMFRDNQNYIDIYFNNAITAINSYAFNNTPNFRYFNFGEIQLLKQK